VKTNRVVALPALGFAALVIFAFLAPPKPPAADATDDIWRANLADAANRAWLIVDACAAVVGGLLLVVFVGCLVRSGLLARPGATSTIGKASAYLAVACLFSTWAAWVAIPAGVQLSGEPLPSAELIRFFNDLGQAYLAIPLPLCAAAFTIAMAIDGLRHRVIPRWLALVGLGVGTILMAGIVYLPLVLFPVWIAAVGLVLARRAIDR